jgi:hypothetical protein
LSFQKALLDEKVKDEAARQSAEDKKEKKAVSVKPKPVKK